MNKASLFPLILILGLAFMLLATPAFACESFNECINPTDTQKRHASFRADPSEFQFFYYSRYLKAIAYKLDEIAGLLQYNNKWMPKQDYVHMEEGKWIAKAYICYKREDFYSGKKGQLLRLFYDIKISRRLWTKETMERPPNALG